MKRLYLFIASISFLQSLHSAQEKKLTNNSNGAISNMVGLAFAGFCVGRCYKKFGGTTASLVTIPSYIIGSEGFTTYMNFSNTIKSFSITKIKEITTEK